MLRNLMIWLIAVALLALAGCRQTADLGDTSWVLVTYGPADAPIPAEAPASIRFERDGWLGGSAGCNHFSGRYEASDDRLTLQDGELAFTARGCDSATPEGRQENFIREWLPGGADYSQTTEQLVLSFDDGRQVAEYRASDE